MSSSDAVMAAAARAVASPQHIAPSVPIKVGVDLGTAFTVIMVTDEQGNPLAGTSRAADVVRDGVVWDFAGATQIVRELRQQLELATGRQLTTGAVTLPPDVEVSNSRAHKYVIEGAGIECTAVVDEPTAANAVLRITDGAVVDIGGGTTGVAILRNGEVLATSDQPSGGTHLSLVIAGAKSIPVEEAEKLKVDPANHRELLPIVLPVLEKMATIVREAVAGHDVERIYLVGGTSAFTGLAEVMTSVTGIPSSVAPEPMLVTPLGVAHFAEAITETDGGRA